MMDSISLSPPGQSTISQHAALALIRAYHTRQVFRALKPIAAPIVAEDDRRRYAIDMNVPVRTPDGATVCTMIVRPRSAPRLPTMLSFTIYADTVAKLVEARRAAASGYIGVVGFARGRLCSPDSSCCSARSRRRSCRSTTARGKT